MYHLLRMSRIGPPVDDVACEIPSPGLGGWLEQLVDQVVHVDKDVAVCLQDILGLGAEGGYPAHTHHGLQCQVVVRVDEVPPPQCRERSGSPAPPSG